MRAPVMTPARKRRSATHSGDTVRAGEESVPMTEDQLRRIFAEGGSDWLEEASMSGLDDQQVVELLDTQTFFELLKLPLPAQRSGVLDRLLQEQLIDPSADGFLIRRLGGLLLARRLADFADLARKASPVVVYTETRSWRRESTKSAQRAMPSDFRGLCGLSWGNSRRTR